MSAGSKAPAPWSPISGSTRASISQAQDRRARGRISKQGSPQARWALVEAAQSVAQQPGPLHAFYEHQSPQRPQRRDRRGRAQARRAVLLHAHPRGGLRPPAALADRPEAPPTRSPRRRPHPQGHQHRRVGHPRTDAPAEKQLAAQAEASYKRSVADWHAATPDKKGKAGASVTPGRA